MKAKNLMGAACLILVLLMAAGDAQADRMRSTAERLMTSGKSMTCDYRSQKEGADHQGTLYFQQGKMRGDFRVTEPGSGTYDGHMVQDGSGWMYMWGGPMGENRGTKVRVDAHKGRSGQRNEGFDTQEEMDLDCREWRPEASKFEVPSTVEFMDLSQMMGGAYAAMAGAGGAGSMQADGMQAGDMQAMKCQICEQIPDESSRGECRRMMGC